MAEQLPQTPMRFIWFFVRRHKTAFLFFVLLQFATGLWSPFNNLLIKWLIDTLAESETVNVSKVMWPGILLLLNFIIFDNITFRCADIFNYYYQGKIKGAVVRTLMRRLMQHPNQFFHDNLSGSLAKHVSNIAENLEIIAHKVGPEFLRGISLLVMSLVAAYTASPLFGLLIAIWFAIFSTMSIMMARQLVALADKLAYAESELSGQIVDILSNQHNVRIFSKQDYEIGRLEYFLKSLNIAFKNRMSFVILLLCLQGGCIILLIGSSLAGLLHLYAQGLVSIGDFSMVLGISISLGHLMWYIMWDVGYFNEAYGKCRQSLSALLVPLTIKPSPTAQSMPACQGEIAFTKMSFAYPGSPPLFENINVRIKPGQKVGLVGYSGGGKSSFISLLLRLYLPDSGSITIDGRELTEITEESLYQHISVIPQEPSLFNRSLWDNICYGRPEATANEIIDAAKKAHAHDFIMKIPEGYNTFVGERGAKLSGGQRQRIALARSILKECPILIMDEATSQLDSVTEQLIQESLHYVLEGKTALIIAHRLSTLLSMDRILVFDAGKIVADGTHEELLAQGGLYLKLWEGQVGGFLKDDRTITDITGKCP